MCLTDNVSVRHILGMNDFARYLQVNKLTDQEAADLFLVGRSHVTRLRLGKKAPSLGLAVRIEDKTQGAVTASSWVSTDRTQTPQITKQS